MKHKFVPPLDLGVQFERKAKNGGNLTQELIVKDYANS